MNKTKASRFPLTIPAQMADDLQVIRDRLFLELEGKDDVAAGFASSVHGEGTTTVVLQLALANANDNRPTVVVDADPQMGLTKLLRMEGKTGFAELIAGASLAEVIHQTGREGLRIIPSGAPNGAQLSAVEWTRILTKVKQSTKIVFLDLPPILSSTAASRVSAASDGLVLVVAAHKTRRVVLKSAVEELKRHHGSKLLGTVLNGREYFIPNFLYKLI
mgnify:CR=1 FL=1